MKKTVMLNWILKGKSSIGIKNPQLILTKVIMRMIQLTIKPLTIQTF